MLRSFRVENHRSIKAEAELQLMPTYDKSHLTVPVVGIFGANASGKSSLLGAMKWMRDAVTSSHFRWDPDAGVPRQPFLLGDSGRAEPSAFVTDIVLDGVRHVYGFEVDDQQVLEEWLYTYPKGRKRVIFERARADVVFGSTVADAKPRGALLAEMTRPNALLVSVAARSKLHEATAMAGWFEHELRIADGRYGPAQGRRLAELIEADPRRAQAVIDLLCAADVGISGVDPDADRLATTAPGDIQATQATQVRGTRDQLQALARELGVPLRYPRLALQHGSRRQSLPFEDESAGTQVWLGLTMTVLAALDRGSTVVVDEIDSSLHPRLTAHLITLFHAADVNPRGAQLIFASHDVSLLGSVAGEDILRRDEVWFVEKDRDTGASTLFALTDFHPRAEDNRERRYFGGSYGAVPDISEQDFRRALGFDPWGIVDGATA
jgi:hypothetical protein